MSKEHDLIKMVSGLMPKSGQQLNKLFESDAEIIELGGLKMLFTIDEFSGEDLLREDDPFILGWNLAVGAVSDILAVGGRPLFYAHSITAGENWAENYLKSFSQGIASVLEKSKASFMGGDFGKARDWRYTGAVIGILEGRPLLRSGAKAGDVIYLSGPIGRGNLEAFLKLYEEKKDTGNITRKITGVIKNKFPLRIKEADLIRKYATACMDTSDGVFNALNMLSEMSGTGYVVGSLPYIKSGETMAQIFKTPKTLLFLGECGEYELIFTLASWDEEKFLQEGREMGLKFYKIGRMTEENQRFLIEDQREIDLGGLNIRARDFENIKEYIKMLVKFTKEN